MIYKLGDLRLEIRPAPHSMSTCRGQKDCAANPDFVTPSGRVKSGTDSLVIHLNGTGGGMSHTYCADCMKKVYIEMRKCLDPNLRILQ